MKHQNKPYPVEDINTAIARLQGLKDHFEQHHLNELFADDSTRFEQLSVVLEPIIFDFSKHRIDRTVVDSLVQWAQARDLNSWIKTLFSRSAINYTEQRSAMHWALRLPKCEQQHQAIADQVHEQLQKMYALVNKIHEGQYRGATGEVIQDVVNIGVGGSDLGPLMVSHALSDFKKSTQKPLNLHFVSTIDGSQLSELLHKLRPETTLFIISSKSFGTIDTLSNAQTVRLWLEKALGQEAQTLKHHFIGVSTKPEKMTAWGIAPENQFLLWDWVGGRYSLWSAIGLSIALYVGMDHFAKATDPLAVAKRQGRLHRNFQGYSTQPDCDLLALGVSSISKMGGVYSQNVKTLEEYYDLLDQNLLPVEKGLLMTRDDLIRREIIMALMCHGSLVYESINLAYLIEAKTYFAKELKELEHFVKDGLLQMDDSGLQVTAMGWYFVRGIAMVFDKYLQVSQDHSRFSKIV